jgi:hypothetical protein
MHSSDYTAKDGEEFTVHHNGDYSGDIEIVNGDGKESITIPYQIIEELVLDKLRKEAISAFEEAEYKDLKKKLLW